MGVFTLWQLANTTDMSACLFFFFSLGRKGGKEVAYQHTPATDPLIQLFLLQLKYFTNPLVELANRNLNTSRTMVPALKYFHDLPRIEFQQGHVSLYINWPTGSKIAGCTPFTFCILHGTQHNTPWKANPSTFLASLSKSYHCPLTSGAIKP